MVDASLGVLALENSGLSEQEFLAFGSVAMPAKRLETSTSGSPHNSCLGEMRKGVQVICANISHSGLWLLPRSRVLT